MLGSPKEVTGRIPLKEKIENVIDAGSQLNDKETEKLRELNIKNTSEGLNPNELTERDNLDAKRTGKDLGPLSNGERNLMEELQKKQSESKNWTGEDANLLHLLQNREQPDKAKDERIAA